ncbi:Chaperone protein HtpG [hydrothermal vent metagenome]|uniref:Chaperone protein HtpG n=1 Tax=hydrothermal vent metagenome TaxID=652676 RepID=A0A3B0ZZG0_9ZZZZ
MAVEAKKETLSFQTEVKQLLHLMIHSLYSNKEIFVRELVSNASDACDKLRFEAIADDALYEGDSELKIRVSCDAEAKTVTIKDNGIGMTREEVIENIGTIANSGTKKFLEKMTGDQTKDANLIGQFGVGFYSSFIVADKVTVLTRKAGMASEHGVQWQSGGEGEFTLENIDLEEHGTTVILHLKEGESEFLEDYRLRSVISKYSDHITLPIIMKKEVIPETDESENKDDTKKDEVKEVTYEDETVNQASALWVRPKSEISEEEYKDFYKSLSYDYNDPMLYMHNRVEGTQSYTTLFYIPTKAPFDMWDREKRQGIKLYVKRVFIMDDSDQLMPNYLRFIKGVVDSDDLPLNISREILQKNKQIDTIRNGSVKKVLSQLEKTAKNDKDSYLEFWKEFGNVLKEGPSEDHANKEKILKLLRFGSTNTNTDVQNVSLDDYISRMKEGQNKIYYITADSFASAKNSPHLEIFNTKGIEVLLLWDRVDEWMMSYLTEFDGKSFESVAKGDLDLGDLEDKDDKEKVEKAADEYKSLIDHMKKTLDGKVKEVRVTNRLTNSPSCLVVEQQDMALNMQKLLKQAGHQVPDLQPTLEINPEHPLVERLNSETDDERFDDWTYILFEQALLSEGGQLEDPVSFVSRMNGLLLTLSK